MAVFGSDFVEAGSLLFGPLARALVIWVSGAVEAGWDSCAGVEVEVVVVDFSGSPPARGGPRANMPANAGFSRPAIPLAASPLNSVLTFEGVSTATLDDKGRTDETVTSFLFS